MIIGAFVLLYGIVQYTSNQSKQFNKSESKKSIFGGNDDLGNWMNVQSENYSRKSNRKNANIIMVIGGILLLAGGVLRFSIKQSLNSNNENTDNSGFHYCTNCGVNLKIGEECLNCK